ncbi:MAG: vWA domain-containing protein [Tuberibacillus sp.]
MINSNFMERRINPLLRITLTDLARTLAENNRLDVEFGYHSYLDYANEMITVSFFWDRLLDDRKFDGMKSDVYLRAYAQPHFTDRMALESALSQSEQLAHPSFFKQLVSLIEEFRIMELAVMDRPGMAKPFQHRKDMLTHFYRERYTYHFGRQEWANALFCACFLRLTERPVGLSGPLSIYSQAVRTLTIDMGILSSTKDVVEKVQSFLAVIPNSLNDMSADYYTIRTAKTRSPKNTDVKKANPLSSSSSKEIKEEKETEEAMLPTWHQEQEQEGNNFLQFDLDEGSKTDLLGEGERKMESGDQAFAQVQGEGASESNNQNQYGDQPELNEPQPIKPSSSQKGPGNGINRKAVLYDAEIRVPDVSEKVKYAEIKAKMEPSIRSLKQSLEKWLALKQTAPRNNLFAGRLGKNLTMLATEEFPRLFYKKHAEDKAFNAVFSLLVDCSASMHDKMEEVIQGVILFHESLRAINVPHAVTGFWEDALSSDPNKQPNYFLKAIEYEQSLLPSAGPRILQLEPQEDNRDGFAIRHAANALLRRPEEHKWLIVFTDGEPSAYGYTDGGIIDTHEAVREARKKGIHVVGVFLSSDKTNEQEIATMKDIYGRESLTVPAVSDIPFYITPMLRKMLTRNG